MQRKSLWGSYKALAPKTRVWLGVGGMVFATAGMLLSDFIEDKRPATDAEREQMEMISPVTVVDHVPRSRN